MRTLNDEVHHAGHGKPAGSDALMPLETSEAACTACRAFCDGAIRTAHVAHRGHLI